MAKKTGLGNLVPLIILLLVIGVLAAIGFVAYTIATDVAGHTKKKMEKKNITVSRDGMKVGIKEVTREQQEDSTQNMIMKVWNSSSWPAYKSRLGWGQSTTPASPGGTGVEKRNPYSRTASSASAK